MITNNKSIKRLYLRVFAIVVAMSIIAFPLTAGAQSNPGEPGANGAPGSQAVVDAEEAPTLAPTDGAAAGVMPAESGAEEVLAAADSYEQALEYASMCGATLKSYAYGIAVLGVDDAQRAIAAREAQRGAALPELTTNKVYKILDTAADYNPAAPSGKGMKVGSASSAGAMGSLGGAGSAGAMVSPSDFTALAAGYNGPQYHHYEMDNIKAWDISTGEGVTIAFIDTGIDIDHPAFAGRISPLAYNSRIDRVGLKYVQDDYGHGTIVSGVAAAGKFDINIYDDPEEGNDDEYLIGVAYGATILPIKANMPDSSYIQESSLLRAINYAVEKGADIINITFGRYWDEGPDSVEQGAIANAVANGVTIVCTAGNDRKEHACYPAAYPEAIAVSSTQSSSKFDYYYSNYGPEIDLSAPGLDIYTVFPNGEYAQYNETALSAANVSGAAALLKAANPSYTPEQIRSVLCGSARKTGQLGRDDCLGYGIVNSYAAVLGLDELFNVTFDLGYGEPASATVKVAPGSLVAEPIIPLRDGYIFDGWFVSGGSGEEFDFSSAINENVSLAAMWADAAPGMIGVEFPDPVFRREALRMLNNLSDRPWRYSDVIDGEALEIFALYSVLSLEGLGIKDLKGIEYFTELEYLWFPYNKITGLDLTSNIKLTEIYCYSNKLTALDVSNNPALQRLNCFENDLTGLDLSNCPELTWLFCDCNYLETLDVTNNPKLTLLNCGNNQLKELILGNGITDLYCYWNALEILDLSDVDTLMSLNCSGNRLTKLDLSNNTKLEILECYENQISKLDISKNIELYQLRCFYNDLTELNILNNRKLDTLYCDDNPISDLNLSQCPDLTRLSCSNINLRKLDLSNNVNLIELNCIFNQLSGLDLSPVPDLRALWCYCTGLTELDLSHNAMLETLDCESNSLKALDLSNLSNLRTLWCTDNYLTELVLPKDADMTSLSISSNYLTDIDVSGFPNLTQLYCSFNRLTGLDISQNEKLLDLYCVFNYMDSLDDIIGLDNAFNLVLDDNFSFYPQRGLTARNTSAQGDYLPAAMNQDAVAFGDLRLMPGTDSNIYELTITGTRRLTSYNRGGGSVGSATGGDDSGDGNRTPIWGGGVGGGPIVGDGDSSGPPNPGGGGGGSGDSGGSSSGGGSGGVGGGGGGGGGGGDGAWIGILIGLREAPDINDIFVKTEYYSHWPTDDEISDSLHMGGEGSAYVWWINVTDSGAGSTHSLFIESNMSYEGYYLIVNFVPFASAPAYDITVTAGNGGSAAGGGTYESGSTATLTATPNSGYSFSGWYSGGALVSTANPYRITVTADNSLQARFAPISITPDGNGGGGGSRGNSGGAAAVAAVADDGADSGAEDADVTLEQGKTPKGAAAPAGDGAGSAAPSPELDPSGSKGYVSGYPDGTVQPNGNITRYETAVIFYNLIMDPNKASYTQHLSKFSDVAPDEWYSEAVGFLVAAGVLSGYPDGTFKGDADISRAEFATIASKFGRLNLEGDMPFTDVQEGHWAFDFILSAYNNGWVSGYPDGTFGPDRSITRAEAFTIVNGILGWAAPSSRNDIVPVDLYEGEWYYDQVMLAVNGK